ncbi:hypothetical protein D3C83_308720 [compost metagenome]
MPRIEEPEVLVGQHLAALRAGVELWMESGVVQQAKLVRTQETAGRRTCAQLLERVAQ